MWLWIIGLVAVLWPVVVAAMFEGHIFKEIDVFNQRRELAQKTLDMPGREGRAKEINELRSIIESQDALIAVLWEKVYGHEYSPSGFASDRWVPTTYDALIKAWGVRPPWTVETDLVTFEFNYLQRDEKYPWGEAALWLRRD